MLHPTYDMRKFKIKNIIMDKTRVVKSRNGSSKNVYDFQTQIPGIHFDESFLTVKPGEIKIGKQRLEFFDVQDCSMPSIAANTFVVNIVDSLNNSIRGSIYLEGTRKDFIREFHNFQLEFKLLA